MSLESRAFLVAGGFALLTATVLGAYGDHGIRGNLDANQWEAYKTAVNYQFLHGLGLLVVAQLIERYPGSHLISAAAWLLLIGILLFSGSIYATTFGAPDAIGALTPLGGLSMVAGWFSLVLGVLRTK